jgi:hypothetical protein
MWGLNLCRGMGGNRLLLQSMVSIRRVKLGLKVASEREETSA